MKTFKIITVTFLATAVLMVAYSTSAFRVLQNENLQELNALEAIVDTTAINQSISDQELIKKGYSYDPETGRKLNISETEQRFRAIEARLSALENK